jgi:hypothetical protein
MLARVERGTLVATLDIAGCSRSASVDSSDADSNVASRSTPAEEATSEVAAAPDFAGTWKQANSGSDDAYQTAVASFRSDPCRPSRAAGVFSFEVAQVAFRQTRCPSQEEPDED